MLAFAGTVAFTLYEVELRKHDYAILNLAGQLRVISPARVGQVRHFLEANAADLRPGQFAQDLTLNLATFDKMTPAFMERKLLGELMGVDIPLSARIVADVFDALTSRRPNK